MFEIFPAICFLILFVGFLAALLAFPNDLTINKIEFVEDLFIAVNLHVFFISTVNHLLFEFQYVFFISVCTSIYFFYLTIGLYESMTKSHGYTGDNIFHVIVLKGALFSGILQCVIYMTIEAIEYV